MHSPTLFPWLTRLKHTWLVTGVAGFIGSNLLETLLHHDQTVIGLDNFFSGYAENLTAVKALVTPEQWQNFRFIEGDIGEFARCQQAVENVDFVLHQAALASVPLSIEQPRLANQINVDGFLNVLEAARLAKVKRVVYASSSAVYGEGACIPAVEDELGTRTSIYATTKYLNECYATDFASVFGLEAIGLRYFNVFGPRQDPNGAYAAVIPSWLDALCHQKPVTIFGDGEQTRDFCFIDNIIGANLQAALCPNSNAVNRVYNIAAGGKITLNQLLTTMTDMVKQATPNFHLPEVIHADQRPGDIQHSQADITAARRLLGYQVGTSFEAGLKKTAISVNEGPTSCF